MTKLEFSTSVGFLRYRETPSGRDYLTPLELEIQKIDIEQMRLFTPESVLQQGMGTFDTDKALEALKRNEGKKILTIDMGGDKVTKIIWQVVDGKLVALDDQTETVKKEDKGANYMPFFEKVAEEAKRDNLGVAISFAGPLKGTSPIGIPNAVDFKAALETKYNGDFANLFPSLKVVNNDAQAGIKTAAIEARRSGKMKEGGSLEFVINGGGFGLAMIIGDKIIATEVGHVRLVESLNKHRQETPCGLLGRNYVCIERVASSGAGVESLWKKITGQHSSGKEISQKYQQGNQIARGLYENSAFLLAHGIIGIANINDLMQNSNETVIAYHGGGFRVPGLMDRVTQIVAQEKGTQPTLFTDDISPNACAEGVAIAAFYENAA